MLWGQYKEIGVFLQKRTQRLLFHLGLGPDPALLEQDPDLAKSSHFATGKKPSASSAMTQAGNIIASYMSGGGGVTKHDPGMDSDEDDDDGLGLSMKKIYNQHKGFLVSSGST